MIGFAAFILAAMLFCAPCAYAGGGGGKSGKSAPKVPTPTYEAPTTREAEAEPEAKAVRDEEKNKLKAKNGMSKTILTSPLGTTGASPTVSSGLLGRV